ncbi:hypothetical protein L1049_028051 [Liquidambar formosana]|uniref:Uncharacterized protein n=1 Tax=Liquidambar formosana TaxID=63359 RepID=A0AAP0WWD0_LIQFO
MSNYLGLWDWSWNDLNLFNVQVEIHFISHLYFLWNSFLLFIQLNVKLGGWSCSIQPAIWCSLELCFKICKVASITFDKGRLGFRVVFVFPLNYLYHFKMGRGSGLISGLF